MACHPIRSNDIITSMRRLLIALLVLVNCNIVMAHGNSPETEVQFVSLRTVSGTVILTAKDKNFPSTLTSLYRGRDKGVNATPAGKAIKVSGSYDGTSTVTVDEKGEHDASYRFMLPVIQSVIESITNASDKDEDGSGSVRAIFDGIVTSSSSADSVVGNTSTDLHVVRDLSVGKITAVRNGNKAIVRGSFLKTGTAAKGRFKLIFTP